MTVLDQHNKIRSWADNHEISPSDEAWQKVQQRLNNDKLNRKKRRVRKIYFFSTIAASLLFLMTFISVIYLESKSAQYVEKGQVESWEELSGDSDYFYNIEYVHDSYKYVTREDLSI